jgi:hypothetical protein
MRTLARALPRGAEKSCAHSRPWIHFARKMSPDLARMEFSVGVDFYYFPIYVPRTEGLRSSVGVGVLM